MNSERPTIGDYYILNTIGLGSTAKVKLGRHKETGEKVAIKIIKKKLVEAKPDLSVKLQREISLMKALRHPNLLKFIDFYESDKYIYLVLELGSHGELFDLISTSGPPSAALTLSIFRQIVYGLDFLHSHNICHRDIKLENILLNENNEVKIADFGFARFLRTNVADTKCGSPHYAAPEVILAKAYDGKLADVWSVGVVFYTLLTGRRPFEDKDVKNLLVKIKTADYSMPDLPPDVQDLISRMLTVRPEDRITIPGIKKHPAFRLLLPEGYIIPSPLPTPEIPIPIDIDKVDEAVYDFLKRIDAKSSDEIKQQLSVSQNTPEKAFFFMMSNLFSFDMLPWQEEGYGAVLSERLVISGFEKLDPVSYKEVAYLKSHEIPDVKVPLPKIGFVIQQAITNSKFQYFFPNELRFIMRSHLNDILIDIASVDEGIYKIIIHLVKGDETIFEEICQKFTKDILSIA